MKHWILDFIPKEWFLRKKNKLDTFEIKTFWSAKEPNREWKDELQTGGNIYKPRERLIFRIYKEVSKLNSIKTNYPYGQWSPFL